jgi:hypothetical protein
VTMRPVTLVLVAVLGFAAAFLAACGDRSHLLPAGDASTLRGDLDLVQQDISDGHCARLAGDIQRARDHVESLRSSVDARLKERLREGANALATQAPPACAQAQRTQTTPQTQTQTTPPTETETTPPTETETTPPTETETTPPTATTPPPGATGTGGAQGDGG